MEITFGTIWISYMRADFQMLVSVLHTSEDTNKSNAIFGRRRFTRHLKILQSRAFNASKICERMSDTTWPQTIWTTANRRQQTIWVMETDLQSVT